MTLLRGKTARHLSCGKQPLFTTTDTISRKTQNERWMGTGRRSICDNHIFRKQSKIPWKARDIWQKIPCTTLEKHFNSLLATLNSLISN